MQRKSKFLFLLLSLMLLCTVFAVFATAADEEAANATFVFKKGDEVLATQTYAEGETVGFTLNTTAKTLEIDLHNFYAKFDSVALSKDGETITELPTTIAAEDLGHTYEIQMVGDSTIKVFAEVVTGSGSTAKTYYYSTSDGLYGNDETVTENLKTFIESNLTIKIIFHSDGTLQSLKCMGEKSNRKPLLRVDFNGQELTAGPAVETLFSFRFGKGTDGEYPHYFYSSQPGAKVIAENATFLRTESKYHYNIGTVEYSTVSASGSNLSIACRALLTLGGSSATCNVDGITYRQMTPGKKDLVGALCYVTGSTVNTTPTVNIKNTTLYLENGYFTAVDSNNSGRKSTVNIENSEMYLRTGVTYRNDDTYAANAAINLTDSKIFSADKMDSLVEGKVFARCDENTVERMTYIYEWVDEADTAIATWKGGDTTIDEVWKKNATPLYRETVFGTYYRYALAAAPITENQSYDLVWKSSASKITGNLTLYANITFNLYFKNDGYIKGVSYNGGETVRFTDDDIVKIGEDEYFLFKINTIAPKDLSAAFDLDVTLVNGDTTATYSVKTSLVKYAASVLKNNESAEGNTLVLALLDYVRETSVSLGKVEEDFAGIQAIDECLKQYEYKRTEWTKPEEVITPAPGEITGAALELVNTPGFVFFLKDSYKDTAEVTVTVNGAEKTYTVKSMVNEEGETKYYFTVDSIHISNYRNDLNITLGEQTFTYNLDVYMAGFTTIVPAYAHALYAYSVAAEAYLAAQNAD